MPNFNLFAPFAISAIPSLQEYTENIKTPWKGGIRADIFGTGTGHGGTGGKTYNYEML